jgi:hypothetical protein
MCLLCTVGHSLYTTGGGGGGGGPAAAAAQYPELYWMIVAPCNMLPVRKTTRRLLFEPFDTKKDQFAKTGSGWGKPWEKEVVFS